MGATRAPQAGTGPRSVGPVISGLVAINRAPSWMSRDIREYFKFFLSEFYSPEYQDVSKDFRIYAQGIPIRAEDSPLKNYRIILK